MTDLFVHLDRVQRENKDKTALILGSQTLSYGELKRQVDNLADHLLLSGVKPNDLVACILPNNLEFVLLLLALSKINGTLVPFSIGMTDTAFATALNQLPIKHLVCWHAVITDKRAVAQQNNRQLNWLSVGREYPSVPLFSDWCEGTASSADATELAALHKLVAQSEAQTYILTMTSGSTGQPKPIALSQETKLLRAHAAISLYTVDSQDVTLIATPLYHSLAQRLIFVSLLSGGTAVILPNFSLSAWLQAVSQHHVSFTIAVSSQLKQLTQCLADNPEASDLSSLRCLVSSSALLDQATKLQLLSHLHCEFHECYGASEVAIATNIKFDVEQDSGSVGSAIEGTELMIIDDHGTPVQQGEIGEICCRTPMQFSGYYQQPRLTDAAYLGDFFKTGDVGKLDQNGLLYFVGRKKELIITGGINVYPSDVEHVVKAMVDIEDCVAISLPNDQLGEVVGLAIIPQQADDLATLIRKIRMTCAAELDHHQQPRHFFIFSSFPQNAMAKLDKRRIVSIAEQYLHDDLLTKGSDDKNTVQKPSLYFVCGSNI